jgi:sRNA-binding protein
MKYTKTVPYFKKGKAVKKRVEVGNTGKTKEEIMAEARSNQTREKGQQAMDKEAKLAAENRKKASASSNNISKPKEDLSRTAPKKPLAKTFGRGLTPINSNKKDTPIQKSKVGEMSSKRSSAPVVGRTVTPVERQVATPIVNSVLTTSAGNPEIENLSDNSIVG